MDNGSTDNTRHIVESFQQQLPISVSIEPEPGLSRARNHGLLRAEGKHIIWTDDDVRVDPDWLNAYAQAFQRWPDAAFFGGKIIPRLEAPTTNWIATNTDQLSDFLGFRDLGPTERDFTKSALPYGANFAIRADCQRDFPYDEAFGCRGNRKRVGEETLVFTAILDSGQYGKYVPEAIVEHMIPVKHQKLLPVLRYYAGQGATKCLTEPNVPRWAAHLPWSAGAAELAQSSFRLVGATGLLAVSPVLSTRYLARSLITLGRNIGYIGALRERRARPLSVR